MRLRNVAYLALAAASVALLGCSGGIARTQEELDAFRAAFMKTFDMEEESSIAGRGMRTLLPVGTSARARATWPVDAEPRSFTTTTGTLTDYPEEGLSTTYVLAAAPTVGDHVYLVTVTTTYPTTSVMEYYRESYYVKDVSPGSETEDGEWTTDDPIVDSLGATDPIARVEQRIHFRDGSERTETIVKVVLPSSSEDGFAAFDVDGTLTFPEFAYPGTDSEAVYSSIVVYRQSFPEVHDFSFWEGVEQEDIVGVRYYTEQYSEDGTEYVGTMVAYEKAISQYTTSGGTFVDTLDDVFVGSEHAVLAESVFRTRIIFDVVGGVVVPDAVLGQSSRMRTHVVDVTSQVDFQLQLLTDDELELLDWPGATYYIPAGAAEEIVSDDPSAEVLHKTEVTNPDGSAIPLITADPGTADLATLYNAIENNAVTSAVTGTDIAGTLDAQGTLLTFTGSTGTSFPDTYEATTSGTVEAWVYVTTHANWGGIVHKGERLDFSDEAWSLQFVSDRGDVAFAIVRQSPSYGYIMAQAPVRLNTNRWYHLVGTWDASTVRIFVNGSLSKSVANTLGAAADTGGPIVVGSQLLEGSTMSDWYGFKGKINAVKVSDTAKTAAQILSDYNTGKVLTSGW